MSALTIMSLTTFTAGLVLVVHGLMRLADTRDAREQPKMDDAS